MTKDRSTGKTRSRTVCTRGSRSRKRPGYVVRHIPDESWTVRITVSKRAMSTGVTGMLVLKREYDKCRVFPRSVRVLPIFSLRQIPSLYMIQSLVRRYGEQETESCTDLVFGAVRR